MAIAISNKLHLTTLISDKRCVNPMDYWYGENEKMRNFMTEYFENHIGEMNAFPDTLEDLKSVYLNGRIMDKLLVLTVVAAFHIYAFEG